MYVSTRISPSPLQPPASIVFHVNSIQVALPASIPRPQSVLYTGKRLSFLYGHDISSAISPLLNYQFNFMPFCPSLSVWSQIGKGVRQGYMLSPCLFNLYAENIIRNSGLDEVQAGIKIAGRNINNLRYADNTTLMAEIEEKLKSLLTKIKEESEKAG